MKSWYGERPGACPVPGLSRRRSEKDRVPREHAPLPVRPVVVRQLTSASQKVLEQDRFIGIDAVHTRCGKLPHVLFFVHGPYIHFYLLCTAGRDQLLVHGLFFTLTML